MVRKWLMLECSNRCAEAGESNLQALGVLRKADAHVGVRCGVVRWCKGRTGCNADARVAHQVAGEVEAVAHAVDVQEAVEGAMRRDPADAVLGLHEAAGDFISLAAALQQEGTKLVPLL